MIRESICGLFPPREVGWGGIWDQFLRKMFGKNVGFSENVFGWVWLVVRVLGAKLAAN